MTADRQVVQVERLRLCILVKCLLHHDKIRLRPHVLPVLVSLVLKPITAGYPLVSQRRMGDIPVIICIVVVMESVTAIAESLERIRHGKQHAILIVGSPAHTEV